jgi:hypothetical protein
VRRFELFCSGIKCSDTPTLLAIALLPKELNIPVSITPTQNHGNDMVEFKPVIPAALHTTSSVALPHKQPNCFRNTLARRTIDTRQILKCFYLSPDPVQIPPTDQDMMLEAQFDLLVNCRTINALGI